MLGPPQPTISAPPPHSSHMLNHTHLASQRLAICILFWGCSWGILDMTRVWWNVEKGGWISGVELCMEDCSRWSFCEWGCSILYLAVKKFPASWEANIDNVLEHVCQFWTFKQHAKIHEIDQMSLLAQETAHEFSTIPVVYIPRLVLSLYFLRPLLVSRPSTSTLLTGMLSVPTMRSMWKIQVCLGRKNR